MHASNGLIGISCVEKQTLSADEVVEAEYNATTQLLRGRASGRKAGTVVV